MWAPDDPTWERARARRDRRVAAVPETEPAEPEDRRDDEPVEGQVVLLYSIVQAARALGVGRSTVYELIGAGDLEVVHIGRSARIPVEAIHAFVRRLRAS